MRWEAPSILLSHCDLNAADTVDVVCVLFSAAACQVAERAGVHVTDVKNVIIWGNHSSTQVH